MLTTRPSQDLFTSPSPIATSRCSSTWVSVICKNTTYTCMQESLTLFHPDTYKYQLSQMNPRDALPHTRPSVVTQRPPLSKFQRELPPFWRYPNFLTKRCRKGWRKPVCQKPARSVQPFWHNSDNTGLWQTYADESHIQCFFVTVRAGTAYRKIWRLLNNFFCIIRFNVQKFQLFWVIFCISIFSLNYGTY